MSVPTGSKAIPAVLTVSPRSFPRPSLTSSLSEGRLFVRLRSGRPAPDAPGRGPELPAARSADVYGPGFERLHEACGMVGEDQSVSPALVGSTGCAGVNNRVPKHRNN